MADVIDLYARRLEREKVKAHLEGKVRVIAFPVGMKAQVLYMDDDYELLSAYLGGPPERTSSPSLPGLDIWFAGPSYGDVQVVRHEDNPRPELGRFDLTGNLVVARQSADGEDLAPVTDEDVARLVRS